MRWTRALTGGELTLAMAGASGARARPTGPVTRTPADVRAARNARAAARAGSACRGCGCDEVKPVSRPPSTPIADTGATLPPLTYPGDQPAAVGGPCQSVSSYRTRNGAPSTAAAVRAASAASVAGAG